MNRSILLKIEVHFTHLLNFPVSGHRLVTESIQNEPTPNGLETPVGASPAVVVEVVLHIVVVVVGPLDQGDLAQWLI